MLANSDFMMSFHPGILAALARAVDLPSGLADNAKGASETAGSGGVPEAALADFAFNHALMMWNQNNH